MKTGDGQSGLDRAGPVPQPEALAARLRERRRSQGLSQTALSEISGVPGEVIAAAERGEREPLPTEMGLLAQVLGVSRQWLSGEPERRERLQAAARFGADGLGLGTVIERIAVLFDIADLVDAVLGETDGRTSERPRLEVPPESDDGQNHGRLLAELARRCLGLGADPIDDLKALAENRLTLNVAEEPLGRDVCGLAALDVFGDQAPMLLVNTADIHDRRHFTLAHQIAHILFADGEIIVDRNRQDNGDEAGRRRVELRANSFAAHFLAPDAAIARLQTRVPPCADRAAWLATALVLDYGLSRQAAALRLREAAAVTDAEYSRLRRTTMDELATVANRGDQFAARVRDEQNLVSPPEVLARRALDAYALGVLDIGWLALLYQNADVDALRAELAAAGWEQIPVARDDCPGPSADRGRTAASARPGRGDAAGQNREPRSQAATAQPLPGEAGRANADPSRRNRTDGRGRADDAVPRNTPNQATNRAGGVPRA